MSRKLQVAFPLFILSGALSFCPLRAVAQSTEPAITRLCTPKITADIVVASPQQRYDAGQRSQPPITDTYSGFAWPDTPMGVLKTDNGYEFFASDGGSHTRQMWRGEWVGNNKSGSVVTTFGTLANPLGTGDPQNVSISQNPDPAVNPDYPSYGYMGGGPVFRVPADMPGAGNLLVVYHAELPNDALYAALGLAESTDHGLHWTDLGEIIRLNQAYAVGLDGFEIGDGPLVLSPDRKYFYLYFPIGLPTVRCTPPRLLVPPQRPMSRLRARWFLPFSTLPSPHPTPTPSHSRSSIRAIGVCNPQSAVRPPTSTQNPPTRDISISITATQSSAT